MLNKVYCFAQEGWPNKVPDLYKHHENEISPENGCVIWGMRLAAPQTLYSQALKSLHVNYPGITRMKVIAQSYFWWTGLDKAIEELGKSCHSCRANQASSATGPLHPWIWPDTPWKRVHIDLLDHCRVTYFFIMVDAHLKWPEVEMMSTITSDKTIRRQMKC